VGWPAHDSLAKQATMHEGETGRIPRHMPGSSTLMFVLE